MTQIILDNITDENLLKIENAFKMIFPQPPIQIESQQFNSADWVKECLKKYINSTVNRHNIVEAKNAVRGDEVI